MTSPETPKRRIIAAAIFQDGMICSVPRPGRHHHILRSMAKAGVSIPIVGRQGFLTSDGFFVDRDLALHVATDAGQIIGTKAVNQNELYSEDLW